MDDSLNARPAAPVRVLLADDDGLFRSNLRHLLEASPGVLTDVFGANVGAGFAVAGEADTGDAVVRLVQEVDADLLLLDLCMPVKSGLEALTELSPLSGRPKVILLAGAIARSELADAIRLGVRGLVLKSAAPEMLLEAIRWVCEGRCWLDHTLVTDFIHTARPLIRQSPATRRGGPSLTRREREVLGFIVAGYANKEIAQASSVTEDSVKHHLTRMYEKLGVSNRVELAMLAAERHLLEP